ncbi:hypothetical protein C8A03DRAFT_19460 [Achaetomium macrosporum]|uniref:C2H2-type domain-containing protein n=1 Tax=Achaetomium macrosporum TaxID=79813 RepID=A0AAN7C1B9_9PEZI|nr:hypothetical protein C8A03DRAFT_19460 [Achaetomium macrosporum]
MQLTGSPICNIAADFGDVVNFDFNSLQAESPKASINPSLYPASSFDPHIRTSGPSGGLGPPFSTSSDFGSSFASLVGVVPFDLTPASSATFTSPVAPKTDNASSLMSPVFPITPLGGRQDLFGQSRGSCGTQLTPSHTMDCTLLASYLSPDSHLLTPSVITTHFDHMSDIVAHRMYLDSSISSDQQFSTTHVGTTESIKQDEDSMTMPLIPSDTKRERVLVGGAQHGTPGLQQVQRCSPSDGRTGIKREKRRRAARGDDSSFALDNASSAKPYKCHVEGCGKSYRRNEHVKRHIQTEHDHNRTLFSCQFCKHSANRRDNYMAHLKLHTKRRLESGPGKPRVTFFQDAVREFAEKQSENRRRRNAKLGEPLYK